MSTGSENTPLIDYTNINHPGGLGDQEQLGQPGNYAPWSVYRSIAGDVHTRFLGSTADRIRQQGVQWRLGHRPDENDNEEMWYMPTFNRTSRLANDLFPPSR